MPDEAGVDSELRDALAHAVAPMRAGDAAIFLEDQIAIGEVKADFDRTPTLSKDRAFNTNEDLWANVIAEKIRANTVVELQDFVLTEWIPRSPGTFHTHSAAEARQEAWHYCSPEKIIHPARRGTHPISHLALERAYRAPGTVVFSPEGKLSMIEGGIGCVRLQPVQLRDGQFWLLGATSSGVAHEGLIVALNNEL